MPATRKVYQFKITLQDTAPPIWRRIQVPDKYTFWDLHVAIQNSMGWFDCHLHAFRFANSKSKFPKWEIGIPDDEGLGDVKILPGWEVPIREYFDVGKTCLYEYDFGDGWTHEVILEGIMLPEKGQSYPVCVGGELSCPPEDCGGTRGYYYMLEVLSDPDHEEHEGVKAWMGDDYNSSRFKPAEVKFDNPDKRWDYAFSNGL